MNEFKQYEVSTEKRYKLLFFNMIFSTKENNKQFLKKLFPINIKIMYELYSQLKRRNLKSIYLFMK